MGARTKARKRAVDLLYEADVRGGTGLDTAPQTVRAARERPAEHDVPPLPSYAVELVEGVVAHRARIDGLLTTYAVDWTLARMPAVDRNILRVGVLELLWHDEVPDAVAVAEAVALASDLSTEESPRFVNGLLARIAREKPELDLDGAPGLGGEHAPADELVGEVDRGGVVDDGE